MSPYKSFKHRGQSQFRTSLLVPEFRTEVKLLHIFPMYNSKWLKEPGLLYSEEELEQSHFQPPISEAQPCLLMRCGVGLPPNYYGLSVDKDMQYFIASSSQLNKWPGHKDAIQIGHKRHKDKTNKKIQLSGSLLLVFKGPSKGASNYLK